MVSPFGWKRRLSQICEPDAGGFDGPGIAAVPGMTIRQIYEQREPLYAQYADVIVASRDGEDDTAHQVEQILRTVGIRL